MLAKIHSFLNKAESGKKPEKDVNKGGLEQLNKTFLLSIIHCRQHKTVRNFTPIMDLVGFTRFTYKLLRPRTSIMNP